MSESPAKKLLALLQRFIDENPGVSRETWSAQFAREAEAPSGQTDNAPPIHRINSRRLMFAP